MSRNSRIKNFVFKKTIDGSIFEMKSDEQGDGDKLFVNGVMVGRLLFRIKGKKMIIFNFDLDTYDDFTQKGYGTCFFNELLQLAKTTGCTEIVALGVTPRSIGFWLKMGFDTVCKDII